MTHPPSAHQLIRHFRSLDCRCIVKSEDDFIVSSICHVEDADPHTLSWYRGELSIRKTVGILVTQADSPPLEAEVVAYHPDPRMILRTTIEQFYPPSSDVKIEIGHNCNIHPSAVLGARGQNYEWDNGHWNPFPQVGGLRIGDDVDIGPCATIMRGTVGDTVIGNGSKIGNGVNIGHDARIGQNALIVSGTSIAGWVRIGDSVKIWQGAQVKNGVRIGDGAQIAMGAIILQDVPAEETWGKNPGRKIC